MSVTRRGIIFNAPGLGAGSRDFFCLKSPRGEKMSEESAAQENAMPSAVYPFEKLPVSSAERGPVFVTS